MKLHQTNTSMPTTSR